MRCPGCGNEMSMEEAFCGQCGMPSRPPVRPAQASSGTPRSPFPLSQAGIAPSNSQPQNGFHQDATEAMSVLPETPGYSPQSRQNFGNLPPSGQRQYAPLPQPGQTANYGNASYAPPLATGQRYYNNYSKVAPQKSSNSALVILVSLCVVIVLIAAIALGTLFFLRHQTATNSSSSAVIATPTLVPTLAAAAATPTVAMTTPTPVASPTPAMTPTPAPDPNFLWCDTTCTNNGFLVEYPQGWQQNTTPNVPGAVFVNPQQPDVYAAFKAPGLVNDTASNIVASDMQINYGTKEGYTPGQPQTPTTTISGETWAIAVSTYQLNGQQERVMVYGTVHQGKAYVIELEAANAQFDSINSQFFSTMLAKFQFQ